MTTSDYTSEIPYGYCHCGCGQKTNIAPKTNNKRGYIQGIPMDYLRGHRLRFSYEQAVIAFWAKVAITANGDLCWEWKGAKSPLGYGHLKFLGHYENAYRIAWILPDYKIPNDMSVLHSCDNPTCVNPKHLFIGTQLDNMQDMTRKGRRAYGEKVSNANEKNPNSKLTENQINKMRKRFRAGGITKAELGRQYGITRGHVCKIISGRNWK